tara:strand:- start:1567 stop:2214 length:648 start_codon:yes stop_codon:yes gene_type:complete
MKIILLQKIEKLGALGDIVNVKNGYARNFLLPAGKALRATSENIKYYEEKAKELNKKNDKEISDATKIMEKLNEKSFIVIRQAGENGQLFGSVTTRDISNILNENKFTINKNQIKLIEPIKALGIVDVQINIHPEVQVLIKLNIARTAEEAELQEKGIATNVEIIAGEELTDVFDEGVEVDLEVNDDIQDESKDDQNKTIESPAEDESSNPNEEK